MVPLRSLSFATQLLLVTAVAAAVRLVRLVVVKWNQDLGLNDSLYYSLQARQLTDGRWFLRPLGEVASAEHGPLTAIVLMPVSWLDDPVPWQRLTTVIIGIAVVPLVGILGRRIADDAVGITAAALAAVYPNLWMNDGLVMSESLAALLVTAALIVLILTVGPPPSTRHAVAFGALVGLAALTRSELLLFVPLSWWVVARSAADRRSSIVTVVVITATSMAVIAPWTIFNLIRFERPVLLTTNDGTTLLGAYCPPTFDGPDIAGWRLDCVDKHPTYDETGDASVRSAAQRRAALEFARERASQLPEMAVRRVARTFDLTAIDGLIAHDVGEEREEWAVRAGIVSFIVLAPLAAVGAMRIRRSHLRVLALPVVTTVLVSAIFYGAHRFRTPMEPVVVTLAAVTLVDLGRHRTGRSGRRASVDAPDPMVEDRPAAPSPAAR